MADITKLARFVGGLPRDVDMAINTLQVASLKVGSSTPAELTKALVGLLATINTTGLPALNMSAGAKQSVLESKLAALRVGVLGFEPTTSETSDVVTTEVLGGAATDTPVGGASVLAHYDTFNTNLIPLDSATVKAGQAFITSSVQTVPVIKFQLARVGTPTGNLRAAIYSDTGSNAPNASLFVSADVTIDALPINDGAYVSFTFTNATLPSAGKYWAVVEAGVGFTADGSNNVVVKADSLGTYPTDSAAYVGSTWQYQSAGYDLKFEVSAAATGISMVTAKGIFVGTVGSAIDTGKVLIRVNGTDNGFDDGTGDEIYGVLSETGGVYTLSYKKHDGTDYTVQASDTTAKFDFYFVEVMDLYSFSVDRLLMPSLGGVVDATTASSIYTEHTARASADSTLVSNLDIEITARIGADESEITARSEADSSIQSNIDDEISARISADSTLDNNINDEISARIDADSTLQANIDLEATARQDADSTLQSGLDGEITARQEADSTLQGLIDEETTARMDADSTLQANIDLETTARQDADSTIQGLIDDEATAREEADSTLQGLIDGEITARMDADSSLQGLIDDEITARQEADSTIQGLIDSEATAREEADSTLSGQYEGLTAADSSLQASIDAEITARMDADSTLQANIDLEATARQDADSTLQGLIDAETTAREEADSSLQISIDDEITARQEADSTLQISIEDEITAREEADSTIQGLIDGEITARQEADSTLQGLIDAETTAREEADSTLQISIDGEITARQDADSTIQGLIDGEITARQEADSTLQGLIDGEITARMDADSSLQGLIDDEITARQEADSTIQGSIDDEATAREEADSTLQGLIDGEITARMDADSSLQALIDAINVTTVDVGFVAATGGITEGDVVALSKTVAGEVIKANATAIATCECVIGVATQTKSATETVFVRTFGEATVTTDGNNLDIGKRVYVYTAAGQASKDAPTSINNVVFLLGGATAINKVFVNPNLEYVVVS